MPPSYRKPRGERRRKKNTRLLFTLDSLPKDSSSPEENSFDSLCFQPRKADRELTGTQIPPAASACPSVWPNGQSLLSSWLNVLVPTRTPTRPDCLARQKPVHHAQTFVFAFAKIIARELQRPPPPRSRLSTCSPLPHYGVSITSLTRDAPVTNPAAIVVPALVKFFA
jgi:hypothetical protein